MIKLAPGVWRGTKEDEFNDYVRLPARTLINLQTGFWEMVLNRDMNKELRTCLSFRLRLLDFCFSGIFPPRVKDVGSVVAQLKDEGNHSVVFYCRAKRERTGFIAAVFRMTVQGWPFEKAYQEWRDTGCRWITWKLWKRALLKWQPIQVKE